VILKIALAQNFPKSSVNGTLFSPLKEKINTDYEELKQVYQILTCKVAYINLSVVGAFCNPMALS
jgi:hypothetical protein